MSLPPGSFGIDIVIEKEDALNIPTSENALTMEESKEGKVVKNVRNGTGTVNTEGGSTTKVAGEGKSTSRHWRKLRTAVGALAAFRSKSVTVADFERIRLCGEGGSGLVYLVKLKNSTMFYALKVQRKKDMLAKTRRIRRALLEREILVTCAHPFVCSLWVAFQDARHLYMVMEYCAGGDMAGLMRQVNVVRRPLVEDEAIFYATEIIAALEWIHLHGFVYRDLKPENVLVHESGHIRLGDFGTAEHGIGEEEDGVGDLAPKSESKGEGSELAKGLSGVCHRRGGVGMHTGVEGGKKEGQEDEEEEEEDEEDEEEEDGEEGEDVKLGDNIVVEPDPLLASMVSSQGSMSVSASFKGLQDGGGSTPGAPGALQPSSPPLKMGRGPLKDDALGTSGGSTSENPGEDPLPGREEGQAKSRAGRGGHAGSGARAGAGLSGRRFSNGRGSVKLNVLLDSNTFIGTADFMAPEMVTGDHKQGTAMDWWALGVMLYELMLGTLPFSGIASGQVFASIVKSKLEFPPGHGLGPAAIDFIEQLLNK
ncbi:unnamed protein product, partial [Discosporangium mesarthrocarpum]